MCDGDDPAPPGPHWLTLDGPPYSWAEIEEYLAIPKARRRPTFNGPTQPCEFCGTPTKRIHWSSPPETWKHLCGRSGDLEFCLPCRAWYPATIEIMS